MKKHLKKIFYWDRNIHIFFVALLLIGFIILTLSVYVQAIYITELETKIESDKIINIYSDHNYEVIPLEDFTVQNNFSSTSIASIYQYLENNNFKNIYLSKGFIEGEKTTNCEENLCDYTLLRFNQKKGMYIEITTGKITN